LSGGQGGLPAHLAPHAGRPHLSRGEDAPPRCTEPPGLAGPSGGDAAPSTGTTTRLSATTPCTRLRRRRTDATLAAPRTTVGCSSRGTTPPRVATHSCARICARARPRALPEPRLAARATRRRAAPHTAVPASLSRPCAAESLCLKWRVTGRVGLRIRLGYGARACLLVMRLAGS